MKLFTKIAGVLALFSIMPVALAANISIGSLLNFMLYLVIIGLIFWLIWWFIGYVGIPEPFNKVLRVVIGLFALIMLINLLLGLVGTPFLTFH